MLSHVVALIIQKSVVMSNFYLRCHKKVMYEVFVVFLGKVNTIYPCLANSTVLDF